MTTDTTAAFGPAYPALPAAAKWRTKARNGTLTAEDRNAYGKAVLDGIAALNRSEIEREAMRGYGRPTTGCPCASGTWASGADSIFAAIQRQNIARFNAPGTPRTDDEIREAYEEAMTAKRAAIAAPAVETPPAQPDANQMIIFAAAPKLARKPRAPRPKFKTIWIKTRAGMTKLQMPVGA